MKNIDQMTKKELASQITRAKMKDANKNLMDNHNKAELQALYKKTVKPAAKPKTTKAVSPKRKTTKTKPINKTTRKTVKKRK